MKHIMIRTLTLSLFIYGGTAMAVDDYNRYNDEELVQMRDQVREMNVDERDAYRTERQQRMQTMSQDERQRARDNNNSRMRNNKQERNYGGGQRQGGGKRGK